MHDIWNPWHGCTKISEGCDNCYMYYLDKFHGEADSSQCYKTSSFYYPLSKDKFGHYKIKSGEEIRVCMCSDFFLTDADKWRDEAWEIMRLRPDVKFYLLTKRPQRVKDCLPKDWGNGAENIIFNVTCENQRRADERIPILLELPFKHKGIMAAPFIGSVEISKYLATGKIESVCCGGENYGGARPCHFEWVKSLYEQCKEFNVRFSFIETGTYFIKDGKKYTIKSKKEQSRQAYKSGLYNKGKERIFKLTDNFGIPIPQNELYVPHFREGCIECASRFGCNGCSDCGKCGGRIITRDEIENY